MHPFFLLSEEIETNADNSTTGKPGRHGILIFSCLLFVLLEKICSITKSWLKKQILKFSSKTPKLKILIETCLFFNCHYGHLPPFEKKSYLMVWQKKINSLIGRLFENICETEFLCHNLYVLYNKYKPIWNLILSTQNCMIDWLISNNENWGIKWKLPDLN